MGGMPTFKAIQLKGWPSPLWLVLVGRHELLQPVPVHHGGGPIQILEEDEEDELRGYDGVLPEDPDARVEVRRPHHSHRRGLFLPKLLLKEMISQSAFQNQCKNSENELYCPGPGIVRSCPYVGPLRFDTGNLLITEPWNLATAASCLLVSSGVMWSDTLGRPRAQRQLILHQSRQNWEFGWRSSFIFRNEVLALLVDWIDCIVRTWSWYLFNPFIRVVLQFSPHRVFDLGLLECEVVGTGCRNLSSISYKHRIRLNILCYCDWLPPYPNQSWFPSSS